MFRSVFGYCILLFAIQISAFSQEADYKLLKNTASTLILSYTPEYIDTSIVTVFNNTYRKVVFRFGEDTEDLVVGAPSILARKFIIGLPSSQNNTVKVLSYKSRIISGRLIPIPEKQVNSKGILVYRENESYKSNGFLPESLVNLSKFGELRGLTTGELSISPVRFYPGENKIEVITSIEVQIDFPNINVAASYQSDKFLNGLVLNTSVAKNWVKRANSLEKTSSVSSALFAQGKWYRFEAPDEGIYKITRDMLSSLGIDPNTADPRKIRIFSGGGERLSETVSFDHVKNLKELAIYIEGQDDGVFNAEDYILLYGRGVNFWLFDSLQNKVVRNRNPYSFKNYYYITLSDQTGKRMSGKKSLSTQSPVIQSTTTAYVAKEEDKINLGKTGLDFYGQEYNTRSASSTDVINLEAYLAGTQIYYNYRCIGGNRSSTTALLEVSANKIKYMTNYLPQISYVYTVGTDHPGSFVSNGLASGTTTELSFVMSASGPSDVAYLDFYEIAYTADLKASTDSKIFFNKTSNATVEYQLGGFTNSYNRVFDITDQANVKLIEEPVKLSGSDYWFQAAESKYMSSKYLAVNAAKFKSPVNMISVGNQNLRGITSGGQYIIITPKVFREQADRLAKYRQESAVERLSSIVIDIDEIFLEFGYGVKDPSAIRDFLTYAYKTWSNKPEFVFLFGDGDYDYRNIEGYNNNFIPTHQIEFSLDQVDSYSFDDFFACIDGNDRYSDIAIGRVTVQSASQAKIVVDKIISYETNTDKSSWRNLITLVSDDDLKPDSNEGTTHIDYSESLAELLPGGFVSSKIYGNLYPEVSTSYGRRRPASNKAIISAINNGTAIVNYYGHGSPEVWSDEQMFTNSASIPALNNPNYFFLAAATCDFGYFDKTIGMSGAEQLIVKENGGAIGTFATNRPVYAQPNQAINELFYSYLFTPDTNEANPMFPIGKVYMKTKQAKTSANDLKFHLFADPALRLILPISSGTIDSINGTSLKQIFQLKGLMKASISGRILKNNGIHNTEFNGEALLSVYDSKRSAVIGDSKANIELPGGLLFRGRVNIVNGSYSAFFVVPKDISSNNQLGKMTLYFFNDKVSGTAYSNNIRVGGFDTTPDDKKGPEISISFDSKMVNDTYVISPYSKMYVNLTDSTAVNTANTGIGHELSAVLNGDEANKIDLSTYYTADINSNGRSGLIEYPLNGLAEGKYTIRIYAYDVFNNLDSAMTSFQVVSSTELQATYITNYPNPFSSRTAFLVDHNFVSPLRISIKVFSVAGRLLHEISETVTNDRHVVIPWDGRDKEGAPLANGVYLYKVKLTPLDGQKSKTVNGKLAITR